jgi:hypothetical protein
VLSADIRWLHVRGNEVVRSDERPILLRGVSVDGAAADETGPVTTDSLRGQLGLQDISLATLRDDWGVTGLRITIPAASATTGTTSASADTWLSQLDAIVGAAANYQLYTILALTASGNDAALGWAQPEVIHGMWALSSRYQEEPAVLFELARSPLGWPVGWPELAYVLVGVIRQEHPASLILVSGADAPPGVGFCPLTFPTGQPIHNIVYTTSADDGTSPFGLSSALASLAQQHPFIVSSWRATNLGEVLNSEAASIHFDQNRAGWMASTWNAEPRLVTDAAAGNLTPSRFGLTVRRALAREWSERPTARPPQSAILIGADR